MSLNVYCKDINRVVVYFLILWGKNIFLSNKKAVLLYEVNKYMFKAKNGPEPITCRSNTILKLELVEIFWFYNILKHIRMFCSQEVGVNNVLTIRT